MVSFHASVSVLQVHQAVDDDTKDRRVKEETRARRAARGVCDATHESTQEAIGEAVGEGVRDKEEEKNGLERGGLLLGQTHGLSYAEKL